jgi:hypothetical protein
VALVLVTLAVVLVVFADGGDDEGFDDAAAGTCDRFGERIRDEYALSFPEGPPTSAAEAEYLANAFADTMDELVAELRALDGSEVADGALDDLDARIAEIRADPEAFVAARSNPFAEDIAPQFDELGIRACGSEFLGGQE